MFPFHSQRRSTPLIHHLDLGEIKEGGRKSVGKRRRKVNACPEHFKLKRESEIKCIQWKNDCPPFWEHRSVQIKHWSDGSTLRKDTIYVDINSKPDLMGFVSQQSYCPAVCRGPPSVGMRQRMLNQEAWKWLAWIFKISPKLSYWLTLWSTFVYSPRPLRHQHLNWLQGC